MEGLPPIVVASFPGPFHLARLLEVASSALIEVAVINIDPPYGVPADRWHHSMAQVAKKRTYIWSNHLAAFRAGYLEPGTSCAVGFPTGAGKSTTAQLKNHAALLRDLKVVFLTPTHALVDLTASHIESESFAEVGLLIFDECHLIHPKTDEDRRAIDAMLCLICFTRVDPDADLVLLSAMVKNMGEIAEWLGKLTERRSIPLDDV